MLKAKAVESVLLIVDQGHLNVSQYITCVKLSRK